MTSLALAHHTDAGTGCAGLPPSRRCTDTHLTSAPTAQAAHFLDDGATVEKVRRILAQRAFATALGSARRGDHVERRTRHSPASNDDKQVAVEVRDCTWPATPPRETVSSFTSPDSPSPHAPVDAVRQRHPTARVAGSHCPPNLIVF